MRLYAAAAAELLLKVSALLMISLRMILFRIFMVARENAKVVRLRRTNIKQQSLTLMLRNIARPNKGDRDQMIWCKVDAKE